MSVNQLQQEQSVRNIRGQDPFSEIDIKSQIMVVKVYTGQLASNSFRDFINFVAGTSGGKGLPQRAGRILNYIINKNNLFTNLSNDLKSNGVIAKYARSGAQTRIIEALYSIIDYFFENYDQYAILPDPNFINDRDEYEKAFQDLLTSNITSIPMSVRIRDILSEIEVITPAKLINDIRTIKMSASTAPSLQASQAPSVASAQSIQSVQSISAPDLTVLRQQFQRPAVGQQFNIEQDVKDYNNYVLYQLANKQSIDTDFINEMKRKYPFIFNDTYERNILGYNGIINSGIVRSNINVDYKDLVLPIPSYVEFAKQKQPVNIQTEENIQNVLSRGYQIIANKGKEVKDEFLSFKQKGQNQFEGKYIQPKLKGSFIVTYNPRYNEYKIVNRNYPTGFVKKPFDIYAYINSLVKKQEKAKQAANPPYIPRVTVAYQ